MRRHEGGTRSVRVRTAAARRARPGRNVEQDTGGAHARRALDLLAARGEVDLKRLGVVGYSLGAQTAAILAGDEPRLKAVGIVAGRGNATTRYWIARAHEPLYFQAGTLDQVVPHAQLVALMHAAPGHPRISWYPADHGMSLQAFDDQVAWQARELGLR